MNTLDNKLQDFLSLMCARLDIVAEKTKVNEFSGNRINSIKSIMLQILQNDGLTKTYKKITCLEMLIAIEELSK